ncbi:hypothetical protein DICPUDRAFT_37512 [Dictyostelium purpureum]|uniref:MD-2-related lipid-recognition domain-containing protein n=1 Tax=Dictyostelium purpureum TaxID=5786 RepID=F0ZSY9_DICPU|nr:uncharacterized protein DICPUDRAFT_37512 [Dictyostelium purpureum]EGC32925.1 hypothetical protein DICPUDRAFT_37512 [Dictyostelium purpureum]|eukprot:XP_003290533.1 hypothetical protein DICPUDRAFT_37512 [Dictyostelium purpureum]
MNKLIIAIIFCLALFSSAFADIWSNCGTSADLLQIDTVDITPNPPQKGQDLTVSASGYLSQTVQDGTANIIVKYGFITLYKGSQDICTPKDPIACPIQAGQYNKTVSATIPSAAPSGKYTGSVTLVSNTGAQIACIDVNFTL